MDALPASSHVGVWDRQERNASLPGVSRFLQPEAEQVKGSDRGCWYIEGMILGQRQEHTGEKTPPAKAASSREMSPIMVAGGSYMEQP